MQRWSSKVPCSLPDDAQRAFPAPSLPPSPLRLRGDCVGLPRFSARDLHNWEMTSPATTSSPWVLAGSPTALGDPTSLVTLVDGQTFCLSSRSGDFDSNPAHGVYFADMRVLSRAHLRIGGTDDRAAGRPAGCCRDGDLRRAVCADRHLGGQPARRPPPPCRQRVARADRGAQLQPGPALDRRRARGRSRLRRRVRDQGGTRRRSRASTRWRCRTRAWRSAGGWVTSTGGPSWR